MESLWRLKRFDAFPKTLEDFRVKTCGGAFGEGPPAARGLQDSRGLRLGGRQAGRLLERSLLVESGPKLRHLVFVAHAGR